MLSACQVFGRSHYRYLITSEKYAGKDNNLTKGSKARQLPQAGTCCIEYAKKMLGLLCIASTNHIIHILDCQSSSFFQQNLPSKSIRVKSSNIRGFAKPFSTFSEHMHPTPARSNQAVAHNGFCKKTTPFTSSTPHKLWHPTFPQGHLCTSTPSSEGQACQCAGTPAVANQKQHRWYHETDLLCTTVHHHNRTMVGW